MRKVIFLAITVFTSIIAHAQESLPLKIYFVSKVADSISPANMASNENWQTVPASSDFVRNVSTNPKYEKSVFQAAYNRNYLFFKVTADEKFIEKLDFGTPAQKRDSEAVYEVSSIEFFIDPELTRKKAAQIIVNINGGVYDALSGGNTSWTYDIFSMIVPSEKKWIMYVAFPWKDRGMDGVNEFGMYPNSNPVIGFNICRNHFTDGKFLTQWSKTPPNSFNRPEDFGILAMADEKGISDSILKLLSGSAGRCGISLEGKVKNASEIYVLALKKALERAEVNVSMLAEPQKGQVSAEYKKIRAEMAKNPAESALAELLKKCESINAKIEKNTIKNLNKDLLTEI